MKPTPTAILKTKQRRRLAPACALTASVGFLLTVAAQAAEIPVAAPENVEPFFDNVRDVALTDWDRDGDLDIVAAAFDSGDVHLWRNQEFGWLESSWPLGIGGANDLAVGDIDGNGQPDLMYAFGDGAGSNDKIGVVLNRSSDLLVTVDDSTVTNPQCVALADLDGDGNLDGITCEFGSGQVSWHENLNGDGETWVTHPVTSGIGAPADAVAHDIDLDGDLDLVVSTFNRVAWIENRLNEQTTTWISHDVGTGLTAAESVVVGDVDGDGEDEIVAGMVNSPLLALWNRPAVLTNAWTRTDIQSAYGVADVGLDDVDQDGDLDILASLWSASSGGLRFWENDGAGAFAEHNLGGNYQNLKATAIGDLDGDGDADFALATGHGNVVETIENLTIRSTVDTVLAAASSEGSGPTPLAMSAFDLDRDGDLDIVSYDDDERLRWRDTIVDSGVILQATSAALNDPKAFELADVDNDGDQDVVMGLDDGLEWLENNGFGLPFSRHTIDNATMIDDVLVVDLDNNGHLDVVGFNAATSEARWWRNTGDGAGWYENPLDTTISTFSDMTAADLDGDGAPEIIIAADGTVTSYTHIADIAFTQSTLSIVDVTLLLAADFDGDGDVDVCGHDPDALPNNGELLFWVNDGAGGGWQESATTFAENTTTIEAIDLDLDGDLDVLGASLEGCKVALNLGTEAYPLPSVPVSLGGSVAAILLAVGEMNGDGFPDAVGVRDTGELIQIDSLHGQYHVDVPSNGAGAITEGTTAILAYMDVQHLGRPGDQAVELKEFRLQITSGGVPLTGGQINGLFKRLSVYRNDVVEGTVVTVLDPHLASPLLLSVPTAPGLGLIDAASEQLAPSIANLQILAELEPDAADVLGNFELRFTGADNEVVAEDPMGTALTQLPWDGRVRVFTVLDSGAADLIFSDGFEGGDIGAWQ